MKPDVRELEARVTQALASDEFKDHPLHEVLTELWEFNQSQWARAEQVIKMSDAYQDMMLRRERSLAARFDKHLRQLEKMTRISDRYQHAMREANQELERASTVDQLTDLPNRRSMLKMLSRELDSGSLFKIAMIDVDYFKRINDDYGHLAGDEVLVVISDIMKRTIGDKGVLARWGGEEFIVLFKQATHNDVLLCLKELLGAVKNSEIALTDEIVIRTSISAGVTECYPNDSVDTLVGRVDQIMYEAKKGGRGCIRDDIQSNLELSPA